MSSGHPDKLCMAQTAETQTEVLLISREQKVARDTHVLRKERAGVRGETA